MATVRGERRRAALVEAAAAILLAHGLDGVSHRAVAERARAPLGATTYYFATLDDLRRAAVDLVVSRDLTRMERATAKVTKRRRSAQATARLVVDTLMPGSHPELVAWFERYLGAARQPVLRVGARAINRAAREHAATILNRSGWDAALPATVALAVVDGATLAALVEGAGATAARHAAQAALRTVMEP